MYKHIYDTLAKHWCTNGSIYFYSDPHFGDLDSYKYFRFPGLFTTDCNVEETIKALDKMQIDSINKVCTKNDCLVILGDVGNIDCVKKLKAGYKVLIMGNHDSGASNYKRIKFLEAPYDNKLFDEVYEGPLFISDRILLSHEPIEYPFALNIHGHDHSNRELTTSPHLNVCAEHIGYTPVCLSSLIKNGALKAISNIHRNCIEVARAKK